MQLRLINTGGDTITESFFIRGILIGLRFGIPVGAVGTLTVQRTFRYGFIAGLDRDPMDNGRMRTDRKNEDTV